MRWVAVAVLAGLIGGCATPRDVARHPVATTASTAQPSQAELLSPTLDVPLVPGKSVAWCATMQMAWDTLAEQAGGALTIDSSNALAADIASQRFPMHWIDDQSVLVRAGPLTERFLDKTAREAQSKFGIEPRLLWDLQPLTAKPAPGIGVFAMLRKDLRFAHAFTRSGDESEFHVEDSDGSYAFVHAFEASNELNPHAAGQVKVLWCTPYAEMEERGGKPEVVVELLTTRTEDRLIAAQFGAAPETLRRAVQVASARALKPNTRSVDEEQLSSLFKKAEALDVPEGNYDEGIAVGKQIMAACYASERLLPEESFSMPVIRIDAVKRFAELEGAVTTPAAKLQTITLAEQLVYFHLDEHGVQLHSEATAGGLFGGPEPRSLDFNRPFLLMLVRRGAPRPYFALWVGGPDVLELSVEQPEPRKSGEGLLGDRMPGAPDVAPASTDTESPTTQQVGESPTTQP